MPAKIVAAKPPRLIVVFCLQGLSLMPMGYYARRLRLRHQERLSSQTLGKRSSFSGVASAGSSEGRTRNLFLLYNQAFSSVPSRCTEKGFGSRQWHVLATFRIGSVVNSPEEFGISSPSEQVTCPQMESGVRTAVAHGFLTDLPITSRYHSSRASLWAISNWLTRPRCGS